MVGGPVLAARTDWRDVGRLIDLVLGMGGQVVTAITRTHYRPVGADARRLEEVEVDMTFVVWSATVGSPVLARIIAHSLRGFGLSVRVMVWMAGRVIVYNWPLREDYYNLGVFQYVALVVVYIFSKVHGWNDERVGFGTTLSGMVSGSYFFSSFHPLLSSFLPCVFAGCVACGSVYESAMCALSNFSLPFALFSSSSSYVPAIEFVNETIVAANFSSVFATPEDFYELFPEETTAVAEYVPPTPVNVFPVVLLSAAVAVVQSGGSWFAGVWMAVVAFVYGLFWWL